MAFGRSSDLVPELAPSHPKAVAFNKSVCKPYSCGHSSRISRDSLLMKHTQMVLFNQKPLKGKPYWTIQRPVRYMGQSPEVYFNKLYFKILLLKHPI